MYINQCVRIGGIEPFKAERPILRKSGVQNLPIMTWAQWRVAEMAAKEKTVDDL